MIWIFIKGGIRKIKKENGNDIRVKKKGNK